MILCSICVLVLHDNFILKLQKHLASVGMDAELLEPGSMDFEYDYPRIPLTGPTEGIASMGAMRVRDGHFTYLDVLKKKVLEESGFSPGSTYGLGLHEFTTWKIRFFLSFPSTIKIGPLNIGTISKVLKGKLHSKIEDFVWNGFGKLTTLPPGLVHDDVISALDSDSKLKELMMKSLLKEKIISVSHYAPKKSKEQTGGHQSFAKVLITSDWKPQHDLLIDNNTVLTYQQIATDIKNAIIRLRYVLENN